MEIIFVCTGNTCRSPMAAAFFNLIAQQKSLDAQASSAGLNAIEESVTIEATIAASEYGVDISKHRPQLLDEELVDNTDLVLTMTEYHRRCVESKFSSAKGKTFTLFEFVGREGDVEDPYGGTLEDYRRCAQQLWEAVTAVVKKLSSN